MGFAGQGHVLALALALAVSLAPPAVGEGSLGAACARDSAGGEDCSAGSAGQSTIVAPATGAPVDGTSLLQAKFRIAKKHQFQIVVIYNQKFLRFFQQWEICAKKALGALGYETRVRTVDFTPPEERKGSDASAGTSLLQVAPKKVQFLLPHLLQETLLTGRDVMHFDADAFLWKDPGAAFSDEYPEADIVASTDCANANGHECSWYISNDYKARHGSKDPIGEVGFMLNMGAILFRSNPAVLGFFEEYIATREEVGQTYGDQTLFNEVFLQWNCTWARKDGTPVPDGVTRLKMLDTGFSVHGSCAGSGRQGRHTGKELKHLNLVVLPYSVVMRATKVLEETVAVHPGGSNKEDVLKLANDYCV